MKPWHFWLLLAFVGLAYEVYAVGTKRAGDTLTENVTALCRSEPYGPWLTWLLGGQLIWLLAHFGKHIFGWKIWA